MGKITGFLEVDRQERKYLPASDRIRNFREFTLPLGEEALRMQAARCMDCGIPYCHSGCPVNNQIPDWNDLVYREDWQAAARDLHSTNNFPEFTGRICPAPCEAACTLNIEDQPVTIKTIECAIADRAWQEGWIIPEPAEERSGKKVVIVGSGPAGLACAQQLARAGHEVHVFEKHAAPGGLLRYGIPDFKMEKHRLDRRLEQLRAEGVEFHCNSHVGAGVGVAELRQSCDALVLAGGSETPRDLSAPGRSARGVHFAMEFLTRQNRRLAGEAVQGEEITAAGKNVVVIGGGDTGSDCIGTSFRQGAVSVHQLEIMAAPPERENKMLTWPDWPMKMRTSSSQAEGAERSFAVATQALEVADGEVSGLRCVRLDASGAAIAGSEFCIPAQLVLLAMGFIHPVHEGMLADLGVGLDARGNVATSASGSAYETDLEGVFAAGDMRRGQSLVVWAIREGRGAARAVDMHLRGWSDLPQ